MTPQNFSFPDVDSHPDFIKMEEELLEHWYKSGLVEKYLHRNDKSKKTFSFLDGPITANNPMGVHHAWGRTYKDLWQRYHAMRGEKERFQNGFDCQGLWVEVEVEKELGFKNKKEILEYGVEKFVEKCKERVFKFSRIQTEQSKRLGYFMDWKNSYFTMSDENNYAIWNFLNVCHERGWIYKGHDSVPWCPRCETAISQHEMLTEDYKETVHRSIYLELPIIGREVSDTSHVSDTLSASKEFLLIWTTTPWTIPANIAVAVDPELDYSLVRGETGDLYWVAKEAATRVFARNSKSKKPNFKAEIIKTVKGKELVGLKYRGPFDDFPAVKEVFETHPEKFHTVIASDPLILPVATTEGTGLIHTAVSAGSEDFKLGQQRGLPMIPVIADDASYLPGFDVLTGKNAKKHPELIFDYLTLREKEKNENWIFEIENYTHRYPICWRCKTELVWKVTDEWYIAMDREEKAKGQGLKAKGKTLREQMKEVAKQIHWIPEFGLERELDWLKNMHDWLISKKNRFWGLALPIWECDICGYFDVIGGKDELREKSVKGWDTFTGHSPHKPWIDEVKIKCPECGHFISRIEPVGNPWLDAGIVPFSTMSEEWFPADFITESFPGQFKNWFYALIAMSTVLAKTNPFKTVLGFATMLDSNGKPFHKSAGNAIEFVEGANKFGADVIRWICASSSPETNILFGQKGADEVRRRFLLILWNSYRFFVTQAVADQWSATGQRTMDTGRRKKKSVLDIWIMTRLNQTVETTTTALDAFQSALATEAIEKFVEDFSTWYIRRSRDRVGPSSAKAPKDKLADKEDCYQTMYEVLVTLSKLIAPFMPFISDVMYRNLTGEESVHLADWLGKNEEERKKKEENILKQMELTRKIASEGHAIRKMEKISVRQPLSSITVSGKACSLGKEYQSLLRNELNVKQVVLNDSDGALSVTVDTIITDELKAEGWARDLIRKIQELRRMSGTQLTDMIVVGLPDWPKAFEEQIKKATLTVRIEKSEIPGITKA